MRKISQFLLTVALAVFCLFPGLKSVEAADLVLLPFVNNVDYEGVEATYFDNAVDSIKNQDVYELTENKQIDAAIEKNIVKGQVPSVEAMRAVAQTTEGGLIIVFHLDTLETVDEMQWKEPQEHVTIIGKCVVYNATSDFYKVYKIHSDERYESGYYTRQNLPLKIWSRIVKHEMNRAMNVKKVKVEKPRIGKFK